MCVYIAEALRMLAHTAACMQTYTYNKGAQGWGMLSLSAHKQPQVHKDAYLEFKSRRGEEEEEEEEKDEEKEEKGRRRAGGA